MQTSWCWVAMWSFLVQQRKRSYSSHEIYLIVNHEWCFLQVNERCVQVGVELQRGHSLYDEDEILFWAGWIMETIALRKPRSTSTGSTGSSSSSRSSSPPSSRSSSPPPPRKLSPTPLLSSPQQLNSSLSRYEFKINWFNKHFRVNDDWMAFCKAI